MSKEIELETIPQLRKAIRGARLVMVQLRFGTDEQWVKISKREALDFIEGYADHVSPRDLEMFGNSFGSLSGTVVYMG